MHFFAAIVAVGLLPTPAISQDRETLGFGRIFNNDYFGDNKDRWRTGSYTFSILRGPEWQDALPTQAGSILEYRLRTEMIAPARLNGAGSNDRAYVGAISAGLHTHFNHHGFDVSLGVDLIATGPQTGIADLQDQFHNVFDAPNLSADVINNQVGNDVYITGVGELAYRVQLAHTAMLRPYFEIQIGAEDLVRVGADVMLGNLAGSGDLWLRDSTTGTLVRGIEGSRLGSGWIIGVDYAIVGKSAFFPDSFGTVAETSRFRARAGYHWKFDEEMSFFYGLTYLSEEFEQQPQGQVLGSLMLNFSF